MKINKWTAGLAAAGVVSLASVAQAEESSTPILTALSSTTISGYVDTSAHWNIGRQGNVNNPNDPTPTVPAYGLNSAGKNDGFNLNSVLVSIEKPLDEALWSAGYRIDLQWGEDAELIREDRHPIRQAYVDMRAPVGVAGLDVRIGRFDTIIGYEASDSYKNPNYTRSYGYAIEPTVHTGVLLSYQVLPLVSISGGVANTLVATPIGVGADRGVRSESNKTYMGAISIIAPDEMGFLAGSGLYAGIVAGDAGTVGGPSQRNYYVGATIATPYEGLRVGVSLDHVDNLAGAGFATAIASYGSFQATDALGLHLRGEWAKSHGAGAFVANEVLALTGTVDYALWQNVLTRGEVRWDHGLRRGTGTLFRGGDTRNEFLLAANVVYKF